MYQHVHLSKQIRPQNTYCILLRHQATNQQIHCLGTGDTPVHLAVSASSLTDNHNPSSSIEHRSVSLSPSSWLPHWLDASKPWFDSRFRPGSSFRSSQTGDLQLGTPVTTLPGAWLSSVRAGTGLPGGSVT